jgi:hypothetical protein
VKIVSVIASANNWIGEPCVAMSDQLRINRPRNFVCLHNTPNFSSNHE